MVFLYLKRRKHIERGRNFQTKRSLPTKTEMDKKRERERKIERKKLKDLLVIYAKKSCKCLEARGERRLGLGAKPYLFFFRSLHNCCFSNVTVS